MPGGTGPQYVRFSQADGSVEVGGVVYGPDSLEDAYPGYVLELTRGFPQRAANAGYRTCQLSDDPWNPARTPDEAAISKYSVAWWLTFFLGYVAEGVGLRPYAWIAGEAGFGVQWLVAMVLVTLLSVPIHHWLYGVVDREVVTRIQEYTTLTGRPVAQATRPLARHRRVTIAPD